MRSFKMLVVPVVLAGLVTLAALAGGLATASRLSSADQVGGTPCPSPVASPVAGLAASPVASPVVSPGAPACPVVKDAPSLAELTIAMTDYAYDPAELTIPADTDVAVTLVNDGALPHNFVIDDADIRTSNVAAGQSTTLTLNLPAGTYSFYCSVRGHAMFGMVGTLTVA